MAFLNAVKLDAPAPAKKSGKARTEHVVRSVEKLAALSAAIEALQTRYAALDAEVREAALDLYIADSVRTGKRPDNLVLREGIGSADFFVKDKGANSAIDSDTVKLLAEADLPYEVVTTQQSYLAVNPKYAGDQQMLALADKLLSGKKGIPDDFIVETPSVSKTIVTKGAIDQLIAKQDETALRTLLPHVGIVQMGKVKVENFAAAMRLIEPELKLLQPVQSAPAAKTSSRTKKAA